MSTHHPHSKRHRSIPDRHVSRPSFPAILPSVAGWRHVLPVRFDKLPDGRLVIREIALRRCDLASAPRQLWNLSKRYVAFLLNLDAGARAIRVLAAWFRAAIEAFKPVPSDTDWCASLPRPISELLAAGVDTAIARGAA